MRTITLSLMLLLALTGRAQDPVEEPIVLDNEPATVTFAFNLGTTGQKADFGEGVPYFITSKVTWGSNLQFYGPDANNIGQTLFMPIEQQNESEGGTAADESNAIRFLFQPCFGFTFTPTKVSLKTTRFGTDNGLLDIAWENPDKTTVLLEQGVKPNRNNDVPNVSELSHEVSGVTPAEGTCGLLINLYHLQNGKQVGFSDIVIEGTLNGTKREVPILASLTINGKEYTAEQLFDDAYEAEFELSKKAAMVTTTNPVIAKAEKGEIGEITYAGDATKCKVTIPMTYGENSVSYVLNIIQKPDYKLTYIDTDKKTVLLEVVREKDETIGYFDYDFNKATCPEGYKVRGWFVKTAGGEKYTSSTVVTGDISLYAVATEIETANANRKYNFDLTNEFFDPVDHEAFTAFGAFYWHDAQHGWAFKDGDRIDLLVGPKATIFVTLCRYGNANDIVITENGKQIGTIPGVNTKEVDGEIVAFNYEGAGGTITLHMSTSGEMYIHAVKIANTSETNYESQGGWYIVKPGDANSLLDVLDVVNSTNADREAPRALIFLPDGVYALNETVKIPISGHNISIIGQSMEKTIIRTAPDKSIEGLGSADMFYITGTGLYLQDLTLQNALDYYGALGAGQVGGRAAVMQDNGNRTIGKRVRMLSYQDTYYSANNTMQSYYEDCDIHGTVDFLCGGGDVRFVNSTIALEPRQLDGKGSRTIAAPRGTVAVKFGYVFDGCQIVDLAKGAGNWNFGRTWNFKPRTVYLSTTLDENAEKTLVESRWTQKGMNNTDPVCFGEYNTMNVSGVDITPASNIIKSHGGDFETILTAEQAAEYSYDKMFPQAEKAWDPAILANQLPAPTEAKYENGAVTFGLTNDGMSGCAIFKNGVFAGISNDGTFKIDIDPANDELTIRKGNMMGGFGPAAHVDGTTAIKGLPEISEEGEPVIYTLQGVRVANPGKGLYIINGKKVIK